MIKKEYIQPKVKEVEIKLPTILAGSPSGNKDEITETYFDGDGETTDND